MLSNNVKPYVLGRPEEEGGSRYSYDRECCFVTPSRVAARLQNTSEEENRVAVGSPVRTRAEAGFAKNGEGRWCFGVRLTESPRPPFGPAAVLRSGRKRRREKNLPCVNLFRRLIYDGT